MFANPDIFINEPNEVVVLFIVLYETYRHIALNEIDFSLVQMYEIWCRSMYIFEILQPLG